MHHPQQKRPNNHGGCGILLKHSQMEEIQEIYSGKVNPTIGWMEIEAIR